MSRRNPNPGDQGGQGSDSQQNNFNQVGQDALAALLASTGTETFSNPLGKQIDYSAGLMNTRSFKQVVVPGLCVAYKGTNYGTLTGPTSVVNVAANSIMNYMRRVQRASKSYDAPEVMLEQTMLAENAKIVSFLKKVAQTANTYDANNRYWNISMLMALGFTSAGAKDLVRNKVKLEYYINNLIYNLRTYVMPSSIPMFKSALESFSFYYMEGEEYKAQLYTYVPSGFYKYMDLGHGPATVSANHFGLRFVPYPGSFDSLDSFLNYFDNVTASFFQTPHLADINGDLARAYGADTLTIPAFETGSEAFVVTDLVELESFKNALGFAYMRRGDISQWNIFPREIEVAPVDLGYLASSTKLQYSKSSDINLVTWWANAPKVFNTILVNPTQVDVVLRSKYMVHMTTVNPASGTGAAAVGPSVNVECAGESLDGFAFVRISSKVDPGTGAFVNDMFTFDSWSIMSSITGNWLTGLAVRESFKFAPTLYITNTGVSDEDSDIDELNLFTDYDNYTLLSSEDLSRSVNSILTYLFDAPISKTVAANS